MHRRKKVDEKSCVTFLLCDPGWYVHDVQNEWEENTENTHTLPPEKSRGLRRGPAQGQRTEVGRIRSCCQGWTGLDDCCEEHGQVAPGGREGSGSTRQRLATRGPSSIQRATPALG